MAIWVTKSTIDDITRWHNKTLPENIGIVFTEIGDDYLKAEMPIDHRTVQPFRTMHGGASATLAETLGSAAAQMCVDINNKRCVGLSLNVSHVRTIPTGGTAYGIARPFHIGRSTQVWDIRITDQRDKLVTVARLTLSILDAPGHPKPPD